MISLDSNDMVVGAVTTLDVKLFHNSTVLCVNEYFLMSSLEKYNYSHEIVINTTGHDLSITRLDEELTEEASCGDLQSEENL
jgi:hypothetical protein